MRTLAELKERLRLYDKAEYIYCDLGQVAWHYSTGDNIELLFIQAMSGYGALMLSRMADLLTARNEAPYHSVFAYRLGSNHVAEQFYKRLGWNQINLGQSIYADDETVLMWITWEQFLKNLEPFRKFDRGSDAKDS